MDDHEEKSYPFDTAEGILYLVLCHLVELNHGFLTVDVEDLKVAHGRFALSVDDEKVTLSTLKGSGDTEH